MPCENFINVFPFSLFVFRLIKDIHDIGKKKKDGVKLIMWQEVMNNDLQVSNRSHCNVDILYFMELLTMKSHLRKLITI